jgi:transcriptional regulator with XRE-family HTH domain
MAAKRIHMKTERAPEEQGLLQEVRQRFQENKPSIDDLVESGEFNEPVPHGEYLAVRQAAAALRKAREEAGLSLAEAAKRSGIDKGALSRLENGQQLNPTFHTLSRYAHALGMRWAWTLEAESLGRKKPIEEMTPEEAEELFQEFAVLMEQILKKRRHSVRQTG